MKKLVYVGPSWAVQNFDRIQPQKYTNLKTLLSLQTTDLSHLGSSNWENLLRIKQEKKYQGIIWIYCEPLMDIETFGISTINDLLKSENFWELRRECNRVMLNKMNELGCPVAVIGAHSDIVDNDYNNLYTVHHSWQNFLGNQINLNIEEGWGAEVAHRWFLRRNIKPSHNLVDKISTTFKFWKQLEAQDLFYEVHPTYKGNELFAEAIKEKVYNFIDQL